MFALIALILFVLALFDVGDGRLVTAGLALIAAHLAFGWQIPRR